jgi:putative transposase
MQRRHAIRDDQWSKIEALLPGRGIGPGRQATDNRQFVDAVFWIAKTGTPWRDLPERFGRWNSVFRRFSRWAKAGVWMQVVKALAGEPDLEALILDSTIVRAHGHAAGAQKKRAAVKPRKPSVARVVGSAANFTSRSMPKANPSNSS